MQGRGPSCEKLNKKFLASSTQHKFFPVPAQHSTRNGKSRTSLRGLGQFKDISVGPDRWESKVLRHRLRPEGQEAGSTAAFNKSKNEDLQDH